MIPSSPTDPPLAMQPGAQRTLLVGTSSSVSQLCHALELAQPRPAVIGCLLPRGVRRPENAPCAEPVLGDFESLEKTVASQRVTHVLVSLPIAMGTQIQQVSRRLDALGVVWRFMPTLADQLAGRSRLLLGASQLAEAQHTPAPLLQTLVDPVALLGREPRALDEPALRNCLTGKVVMITGAGGSIGSELARLAARFQPALLLLVERGENALFEIDRHIAQLFPHVPRLARLHDVTDAEATDQLLGLHQPHAIFHAAAHKHVPMMEEHPAAAIENNFYGSRSVAEAAARHGAERFVMISTDKAVNPSSVMGATKRLAELYVQHLGARSDTRFSMVRFGNVLGSACSVLPIWGQQLAQGQAVTVTHPEMRRYFMTIPEAAGLVLEAGAISQGGEVFLLDMGKPIRILDLARRFIQAHGLEPEVDVPIRITGIRPGEKLFEELAYGCEQMTPTTNPGIRIWRTRPPSDQRIAQTLRTFDALRNGKAGAETRWRHATREAILTALHAAIPEMVEPARDEPAAAAS